MIITIDGPSSSGKSTVAKLVSKFYSIVHIDSGSIYRAITLLAMDNNLIHEKKVNIEYILKCLEENKISFKKKKKKTYLKYVLMRILLIKELELQKFQIMLVL
jgi:cytidylate kinase